MISKKKLRHQRKIPSKTHNFVIIGPGHWGSALGHCLTKSKISVCYLGPESSRADWDQAFDSSSYALIATPFSAVSSTLDLLSEQKKCVGVLNASKGIDRDSLKTFSQIAAKKLKIPFGSLSGPSFAKELLAEKPTACIFASKNIQFSKKIASMVSNSFFRVYAHQDPVGVELCGALKNVLAIACGISDGLQLGFNARAALLTRGSIEMLRLIKSFRANPTSVFGLAGTGDLWMTATGDLSRNRQAGLLLAKGLDTQMVSEKIGQPIEGFYSVEQVEKIRRKKKLELPICELVYKICFKRLAPESALIQLMSRPTKTDELSKLKLT